MGEKISFGLTAPLPGKPVTELVDFAVRCEEAGFDAVWYPDHILFMAKKLTPGSMVGNHGRGGKD